MLSRMLSRLEAPGNHAEQAVISEGQAVISGGRCSLAFTCPHHEHNFLPEWLEFVSQVALLEREIVPTQLDDKMAPLSLSSTEQEEVNKVLETIKESAQVCWTDRVHAVCWFE